MPLEFTEYEVSNNIMKNGHTWFVWFIVFNAIFNNIWVYNYLCNQYLSPLTLWVRITLSRGFLNTIQPYVIKYFSDMTEILLKMALNTINQTNQVWPFFIMLLLTSYSVTYHWNTLSRKVELYWENLDWAWFELTTLVVIGTDCIGSYKPNQYTITTTTVSDNF
jgi:hypothetical protein